MSFIKQNILSITYYLYSSVHFRNHEEKIHYCPRHTEGTHPVEKVVATTLYLQHVAGSGYRFLEHQALGDDCQWQQQWPLPKRRLVSQQRRRRLRFLIETSVPFQRIDHYHLDNVAVSNFGYDYEENGIDEVPKGIAYFEFVVLKSLHTFKVKQ